MLSSNEANEIVDFGAIYTININKKMKLVLLEDENIFCIVSFTKDCFVNNVIQRMRYN